MKKILNVFVLLAVFLGSVFSIGMAVEVVPPVVPATVDAEMYPGTFITIDKTVTTPAVPPVVDICLLQDETGSFWDDIGNLQAAAPGIYDNIIATSPDAQFAVAGFRDYPISPYGNAGDWVYRLVSSMSPVRDNWINGVVALTAGGGWDTPEAQYDAIVAATGPGVFDDPTKGPQNDCGWRADANVQKVLVVTTDAPFHQPVSGKPHVNDHASTVAALSTAGITLIGLKAPGAGVELDALAAATGGSVQPLSSDSGNIANAILAGLAALTTDIWWTEDCGPALDVSLSPLFYEDVAGGTSVQFEETISVPNATPPGDYSCTVTFWSGEYGGEGVEIGPETITIKVNPIPVPVDIKPASCPNPINVTKMGVQSVAILGTEELDVTTINPESVKLEGVAPLRWAYEDVGTPYEPYLGKEDCKLDCTTAGPDGYMDLVFKFDTMALVEAIEDCEDGQCLVLTLTGNFMDGRAFMGEDVVLIIAKKK